MLATVGMHLGIAAFLGLHIFGLLMAALTLAAFGVEADPEPRPAPAGADPAPVDVPPAVSR